MNRRNINKKTKKYQINYLRFTFSILFIIILIIGVIYGAKSGIKYLNKKTVNIYSEEEVVKIPPEPEKYTLSVTAGGDLLIHSVVYKTAKLANGSYNFNPMFENVKHIFKESDLSIINLEVPVAGNKLAVSTYPMFNSPVELLDAVKTMGIDVVATANNHALDKRFKGLETTIDNAIERNLKVVGTSKTKDENSPIIIEKNNIKVAIAAYTYGTNGIPIPPDYPICVNIINRPRMLKDISYMKEQGADFIIFALHFGQEYQLAPNNDQKELVDFLISNDVDVIFGSHPHVPQPYELRKITLEDGTEKEAFVIYSMGNFISAQLDYYTKLGAIATVNLSKQGEIKKIEDYKVEPIYTDKSGTGINKFKVIPLEKSINDYYKNESKKYTKAQITNFEKLLKDSKKIFDSLLIK